MGLKKKKGGKKGKKDKKLKESDNMTPVDKTFYELTISDLNNKLSRLRSEVAKLENNQEEMEEQMKQFEEDRTDVTAYLQRQLAEKINIIRDMDEKLLQLEKVREEENKRSYEQIQNLESKYKAMHEQLTSEIKLLNGKLNSLEEFRLQRANLLMKFDEQETEMKEQRRLHREKIHEMEQKTIIENDKLKKGVQTKLLELSETFTKSSEIRIAGYTRRLIRENISLNKEMDKMIQSQIRMENENKKIKESSLEVESSYESSIAVKERLMRTCQNQIQIIQNLTQHYEALQSKYHKITHYKKLYESSLKRDICDTFSYNDMTKKLRIMTQRVEKLKGDKQKLISMHQQHEAELIRLQNILNKIKFTVQSAIQPCTDYDDTQELKVAQRKNLLTEMMKILTTYSEEKPCISFTSSRPDFISLYRPGFIGLTPKGKASLLELFKRKAKKIASTELYLPVFKPKLFDSRVTPQEHLLEGETLLDVKSGSTITFSTGHDEDLPEDNDLQNQEDYNISSKESHALASDSDLKNKKEGKFEKMKVLNTEEKEGAEEEQGLTSQTSLSRDIAKTPSSFKDSDVEAESAALFEAMTEAEEEKDEAAYFLY